MACESLKGKLDTYLDGELPEQEMRTLDSHVRSCASCSSDALGKLQMKRAVQVAGNRFTPSAEFRKRIEQAVAPKRSRGFAFGNLRPNWILAVAACRPRAVYRKGREQPICPTTSFQRDCRFARGNPGKFLARRRNFHRSTHRETLVSREDSLLLQSAGSPEH